MTFEPILLGPLPVELINRLLGTELEPGEVVFTIRGQRHAAVRHPDDYDFCLSVLREVISAPTFVGQAPEHADGFEMLRRCSREDGKLVIAAVSVEPDATGKYRIHTTFLIESRNVERRRQAGRLKLVLPT